MIDLHTHVLPGVDDGTRTLDEACELVRLLGQDGVQVVAATPHVRDDYPTTPERIESGVAELRRELERREVAVSLVSGAEVALDRAAVLDGETLRRLSYAGRGSHLLVEFPYVDWPLELSHVVQRLLSLRLVPVLAHPERNPAVQRQPGRLADAVRAGALVQVTGASLLGTFGRSSRACARELVAAGLAHVLASDVHDPVSRDVGLSRAAATLRDPGLAWWMTTALPTAIVTGVAAPERPEPRRRSLVGRILF